MSSLRGELEPPKSNGGKCSVQTFVTTHQPTNCPGGDTCRADPADWIELLDDKEVQHSQMHRLMRKHGYPLTANPVTRHRNGLCACGRAA